MYTINLPNNNIIGISHTIEWAIQQAEHRAKNCPGVDIIIKKGCDIISVTKYDPELSWKRK